MDKKTQRYDRQLRLWQAHGQANLEAAKVCLIHGTATGTETLKNLVLPGIGAFTVLDGARVTPADVGNNFFLTPECVGKSRSKCVTELLCEMNSEVEGFFCEEDPVDLIEQKPDYFLQFTLVIATDLPQQPLLKLAATLWDAHIPLVVARSYGFVGYCRIAIPEHVVPEPHPDSVVDLRLDCPFLALAAFVDQFDFKSMDSKDHTHTPFPVILIKCLQEWRSAHEGKLPASSAERNQFKELIRSYMLEPDEENFEEALAASFRACKETTIPGSVLQILKDPACDQIGPQTPNFWIIARAVRDFVANEGAGLLPLPGVVPDMKADTAKYVAMQTIYRQKAREDTERVVSRVQQLLQEIGRPVDAVPVDEIERFCKNSAFLKVIRYRSLASEYGTDPRSSTIESQLSDPESPLIWYALLRAVDLFYQTHKRYPGIYNEDVDADISLLKKEVVAAAQQMGISAAAISDDYIHECVRAGASELHNIAAFMGGVVSQEIIKIITHQYVPLNNTFVLDGIKSKSLVEEL
ncbi:hypothetical protein DFJ74DRAFT_679151 [Hyaloraphidium curvatum]|nr:hypothetical protein DFJ74DRAFT_679151 [Hyaloraphidium curvatum]